MHSNIYALRCISKKYPKPDDYEELTEETLDFDRVSYFADYISDYEETEYLNEVNWIHDSYPWITVLEDKDKIIISFTKKDLENHLNKKFTKIQKIINKYSDGTEFYSDSYNVYELKKAIEDMYGFYIVHTSGCKSIDMSELSTIDYFLYYIYSFWKSYTDEDTIKFRVEGILDYHA